MVTPIRENPMQEKIIQQLNWRYAVKKFAAERLPRESVDFLLECLRLSASAYGLQPWKFIHVENTALREKLLTHSMGQEKVVSASDLIVLARQQSLTTAAVDHFAEAMASVRGVDLSVNQAYIERVKGFVDGASPHKLSAWMAQQVYIALGTLLTAAAMAGIDACPMAGFDNEAYDRVLGLEEEGLRSVVIVTLGYRAADDKYAGLKKVRYPRAEVVRVID
jgi:nitroreductase / dihydropteridine reductase